MNTFQKKIASSLSPGRVPITRATVTSLFCSLAYLHFALLNDAINFLASFLWGEKWWAGVGLPSLILRIQFVETVLIVIAYGLVMSAVDSPKANEEKGPRTLPLFALVFFVTGYIWLSLLMIFSVAGLQIG